MEANCEVSARKSQGLTILGVIEMHEIFLGIQIDIE